MGTAGQGVGPRFVHDLQLRLMLHLEVWGASSQLWALDLELCLAPEA